MSKSVRSPQAGDLTALRQRRAEATARAVRQQRSDRAWREHYRRIRGLAAMELEEWFELVDGGAR